MSFFFFDSFHCFGIMNILYSPSSTQNEAVFSDDGSEYISYFFRRNFQNSVGFALSNADGGRL